MKIKRLLMTVAVVASALTASAQGWPANYGGVMLQGFYWDSYDDTKWTNLTEQADELSKYFDLIWVPNSGYCRQQRSMGYNPVYWYNHNSAFGKPKELLNMISTFKAKGTGIIMDVVINHRNGVADWADFPAEKNVIDGKTYQLTSKDVTKNDDGGYTASKGIEVGPNYDTGDDFSGGRDLDHMSTNVQENCKAYCKFLLEKIGYVGFRLDMVKGYGAQYTKMYNEYSKPQFCVGEYWDGTDAIRNWINGTGKTSAAFDFPLKYQLNKAFSDGTYSALDDKGLAGSDYSRYSVTFVDNHDSDREDYNRCVNNQLGATAFILAMPGTPCIFLKHWKKWSRDIGNMILARKAAGLTNQSAIVYQGTVGDGYVLKTQGSKGTVMVLAGNVGNYDTAGFKLITSGSSFAYYVSDNVTVEGLNYDPLPTHDYKLYVCAHSEPNVYAWDNDGNVLTNEWPGTKLTTVEKTLNGTEWYYTEFKATALNVILNNGTQQTANIEDLNEGATYLYYTGKSGYEVVDENFFKPVQPQGITVHVAAPSAPWLYAWDDGGALNGEWPGTQMTKTETSENGTVWYVATLDADKANIIFNNGKSGDDERKTADILGLTGADVYYAYNGYTGCEVVDKDYQSSGEKVIVHVCADAAPYLYAWNANGTLNGEWPGTLMTDVTTTSNGTEWYTTTLPGVATASIIFNNGNGAQTADITDVSGEVYYYYNGKTGFEKVDANYQKSEQADHTIAIYVKMLTKTRAAAAPYLYAWDEYGSPLNGAWPGTLMTETEVVDGETFFVKKLVAESVNVIFNDGTLEGIVGVTQTANIEGITADRYFEYDGGGTYTDVTDSHGGFVLPDCAVYQADKLFIYFEATADYPSPYVWAWGTGGNISTEPWPGNLAMTRVGDSNGNSVYTYVFDAEPTGLLFVNVAGGAATTQTSDFDFTNAGYYTVSGLKAVVPSPTTGIGNVNLNANENENRVYDLQGRRVSQPTKGLYIMNGRKVVIR